MLPFNSANKVTPGGPVSRIEGTTEIFGGAKTTSFANARLTSTKATIGRVRFFAGVAPMARKILQQGESLVCFSGADFFV